MKNRVSTVNDQEVSKFAQQATHWWDKQGPLKTLHDINEARLGFILQHIALKDCRILDVGCGGGILSEAMAKVGSEVVGIDAEAQVISLAIEHAKESQLAIEYHCTPVETFQSQSFDAITCMELLEHVQHPELVLEHCRRLLKPKGILFLSTISRTLKAYVSAIFLAEYVLNLLPKQTHDYDKLIKPSELLAMARAFDFEMLDLKGLHYNPLLRKASLSSDVSVNYLLALQLR